MALLIKLNLCFCNNPDQKHIMGEYTYSDFLTATAERRCHEYTTLNAAAIFPEQVELLILGYLTIEVGCVTYTSFECIRSVYHSSLAISEIDMRVTLNVCHRSLIQNGVVCNTCGHTGPHLQVSIDADDTMDRKFTFIWDVERILEYFETDDISHLAEPIVDWFNIHVYVTDEDADEYMLRLINRLFNQIVYPIPDRINWNIISQNDTAIQYLVAHQDNINWNLISKNDTAIQYLVTYQDKII